MTYEEKVKAKLISDIQKMDIKDLAQYLDCEDCPLYDKCQKEAESTECGCRYIWRKYGNEECEYD